LQVTFLGTGTSMGIPMIGCQCKVCQSKDPRDKRTRTSVWLKINGINIIIDTGIDFRQQALRENISTVDAVLFTHHHVDHIFGLDELRAINFLQKKPVAIYSSDHTYQHLKRVYKYVFDNSCYPSDTPEIDHQLIDEDPFQVFNIEIIPVPLFHGELPVFGFRIGNFSYCTDVSRIPPESYELLQGSDVVVLGALRDRPHPTHFTIEQAVVEAQKIGAKKTYLVHLSHEVGHQELIARLAENVQPAFDGLKINVD
jgi:phosphoribosyl 1,2-cyclic phosphate phosphodiesterase